MNLPRAEDAVIPRGKIEDYLLSTGHPVGGSKAVFFLHFGFRREAWQELAEALRRHAVAYPVAGSCSDADGVTYLVEGPLETPTAYRPTIRAVWLIETGELAPRFITAYPLRA